MDTPENHYVLIVHGTFNPPGAPTDPPKWYQPGGEFARALAQALKAIDPAWGEAVWRVPPGQPAAFFAWSGANTHAARVAAAAQLSQKIRDIVYYDRQARIHLIGHSHGGNVILKALELDRGVSVDHLGRLVFLGTPFFHKRWRRSKAQLRQRQAVLQTLDAGWRLGLRLLLGAGFVALLGLAACYLPTLGLSAVLAAARAGAFVGFNPLSWPGWAAGLLLAGLLLGAAAWAVFMSWTATQGRAAEPADTNYYYDEVNCDWFKPRAQAPPAQAPPANDGRLPALVVNAGALDEALMALSSERLWSLLAWPAVNAFTRFRLDVSPRPPEIGVPHEFEGALQVLKGAWLRLLKVGLWPVTAAGSRLLQRPAANWLMSTLRQVLVSTASGLPPHEVDDADLVVRPRPGVALLDDGPAVWDVSEYLAHHRVERAAVIDPLRYRFFWDAADRQARFEKSLIYAALERRGLNSPELNDADFQRTCLAIEERLLEITGGLEMLHSRYYQDPVIVQAVARFLATGLRPEPLTPAGGAA